MNMPDKLTDAKVYLEGNALLGVADVELPSLEMETEKLEAFGIAGSVDMPSLGHFKEMSLKLKFRAPTQNARKLREPKTHQLELYASVQMYDQSRGEFTHTPYKVVLRGIPKKLPLGKLEKGKPMDMEYELEVVYLKVEEENREVLEIDKLAYVYKVNGTDYLSQVRQNLGGEG